MASRKREIEELKERVADLELAAAKVLVRLDAMKLAPAEFRELRDLAVHVEELRQLVGHGALVRAMPTRPGLSVVPR